MTEIALSTGMYWMEWNVLGSVVCGNMFVMKQTFLSYICCSRIKNRRSKSSLFDNIYIYEFFSVSDEQVAEDSGFIQVTEAYHVLHSVDGGGVHWLDVGGVLGGDPVLLRRNGAPSSNTPHILFSFRG